MRGWIVYGVLAVGILLAAPAMARQSEGFAGTAFGTPLGALPSFMVIKKDGEVTYAVNLKETYRLDGRAPVVVYGFALGKLFAAYVRLDGLTSRDAMVKRLTAQYGKPAASTDNGVEVLRWSKGKTKVKLKSNPATGSLKLGYYSLADGGAAGKRLDLDNVDLDALVNLYEKDKVAKDVTLPAAPAPKSYSPNDDSIAKSVRRMP
jgi:hypothetical protein